MRDFQTDAEYLALLRGILERPEDDAPRLILSDWLEENGNERLAEFIRKQVEISTWNQPAYLDESLLNPDRLTVLVKLNELWEDTPSAEGVCRIFQRLMPASTEWIIRKISVPVSYEDSQSLVSRGFVCEIYLSLELFIQHARELFSKFPISAVRLTDKKPLISEYEYDRQVKFLWAKSTNQAMKTEKIPDRIPPDIFQRVWQMSMPEERTSRSAVFITAKGALIALSDACMDYGRDLAGLPPLKLVR